MKFNADQTKEIHQLRVLAQDILSSGTDTTKATVFAFELADHTLNFIESLHLDGQPVA